jgi:mono/diheme cytochrome c family protein
MSSRTRVKTRDGVLIDEVYQSPVDRHEVRFRRFFLLSVLVVVALLIGYVIWSVTADRPVTYSDITEHFRYGSIGSEPGGPFLSPVGGVLPPYWVFKVLPAICPDKLPGGYAALGFIYEPGRDLPIGISRRRRLGVDQVGVNCAACHTGTVRESPTSEAQIVLGMPAHQLDLQRLFDTVVDCTLDERLTLDNLLGTIKAQGGHLGLIEGLLYKTALLNQVRTASLRQQGRSGLLLSTAVPAWGRGRVDTFNPYKAIQFNWSLQQLPAAELIGAADLPSLWNQQPREGMQLHWDGDNTSVDERNLSAALGAGVTPVTVDHNGIKRVRDWIWTLKPPPYPYAVDAARAARGREIYERLCAECHSFGGQKTGTVVDIDEIGTDPYRLNSYTHVFAVNQATLFPESKYRFTHFRKTHGYANQPLDGIWARAPYLHNGSVPTLWDLLQNPESRPPQFSRGYDVYDKDKVGFVTETPEAQRAGSLYDTTLPGNGNGGHVYGTHLSDEEKRALVEYMKTL